MKCIGRPYKAPAVVPGFRRQNCFQQRKTISPNRSPFISQDVLPGMLQSNHRAEMSSRNYIVCIHIVTIALNRMRPSQAFKRMVFTRQTDRRGVAPASERASQWFFPISPRAPVTIATLPFKEKSFSRF